MAPMVTSPWRSSFAVLARSGVARPKASHGLNHAQSSCGTSSPSEADGNAVVHRGDARSRPSGMLCLLFLRPRAYGPLQDDLAAALHLDGDPLRVEFGVAHQGAFD